MEQECSICKNPYDMKAHYPMLLCLQQHLCCDKCLKQIYSIDEQDHRCPHCRQPLKKENITKFRFFQSWLNKQKEKIKLTNQNELLSQKINDHRSIIRDLLLEVNGDSYCQTVKLILPENKTTFFRKNSDLHNFMLQNILERFPNEENMFIGLGSKYEQQGYSETKGYQWYQQRYHLSRLSLYDQLAVSYMLNPNYQAQKAWYQKMIECDSTNFKALYGLALVEQNKGKFEETLQLYKNIIQIKPDFDKPYEMIGFIHLQNTNNQHAQQYAQLCLSKNPSNMFAEFILAASINTQDKGSIRQTIKILLEKEPTYVRAMKLIGDTLFDEKRYQQAIQTYKKCLSINEHYFEPHYKIADALMQLNESLQLIQFLQSVLEKSLNTCQKFNCYFKLGGAYESIKNKQTAISYYKRCLRISPESKRVRLLLAYALYQKCEYQACINELNFCQKIKQFKMDNNLFYIAKQCYRQLGKIDEEFKQIQKWKMTFPEDLLAEIELADVYFRQNDLQSAMKCYQKCIQNNFRQAFCHLCICQIFYSQKKYEETLKSLDKFQAECQMKPKQKEWAEFQRGQLLQKLKENKEISEQQVAR